MTDNLPADFRTRLFQRLTDHYPTHRIHRSRFVRGVYRLLLELIRPDGTILLRTSDYRLRFRRLPRRQIARFIAIKRAYEPLVTDAFRRKIADGGLIVDVGANIGHYTLVAALAVGARGHVVAFEPVPEIHAELGANVALNGLDNVTLVEGAAGATAGELTIHRHARNPGGHSLAAEIVQDGKGAESQVRVYPLDELLEARFPGQAVRAIKIDVEGFEAAVLEGAQRLLARDKPAVIFEFWPYGLDRSGYNSAAMLENLVSLGYRFQRIDEMAGRIYPVRATDLLAACRPHERADMTYVLAEA